MSTTRRCVLCDRAVFTAYLDLFGRCIAGTGCAPGKGAPFEEPTNGVVGSDPVGERIVERMAANQALKDHVHDYFPKDPPPTAPEPLTDHGHIPLLDHGYVRLVETWGHGDAGLPEAGIIEAARQSTQGAFRGWEGGRGPDGTPHPGDKRLLAYLYNNKHSTPFEFAGMTLEIQAPLFVFREWHRHRTQSYSEMSARYEPLPDMRYMPTVERLMMRPDGNKQAGAVKGSEPLSAGNAEAFREQLQVGYDQFASEYAWALGMGVPKELARCGMPVGHYSRMRATANLRNWLGFLTLRTDPAAQWEIRQYALAVADIVSREFPRTSALFNASKAET